MGRISVKVDAGDCITRTGMTGQLGSIAELRVVESDEPAEVAVVCAGEIDHDVMTLIKGHRHCSARVVVVTDRLDHLAASSAVEAGATALLRRSETDELALRRVVMAASRGEAIVPADLLGELLDQFRAVHSDILSPRGLHFSGLSDRESEVLGLVAEGHETREIAGELAYSERTIKNVIHDIMRRYGLRNRSHAVAYALRHGLL